VQKSITTIIADEKVVYQLVLTEHEVLHLLNVLIATRRKQFAAAWLPAIVPVLPSLQQTIGASGFQPVSGNSLNSLRVPYPFNR